MRGTAPTLTTGSVATHLVKLTIPMIWGILAMMAFNLTDTWFVAQLGEPQLAAMSFTFPVVMLLISLGIGMMAATSSVLARAIGAGEHGRVRRYATDAMLLALILSIVCTALGMLTIDPLFTALGANAEILPLIREYMTLWYAGYSFILLPMVGFGALRATGDSGLQGNIMIAAAVINLILDPLLIFGLAGFPRLELQGAAMATVVSRAASLVAAYWALRHKHALLALSLPTGAELRHSWSRILQVGLPAAGTNMIIPAATAAVVSIIAGFGPAAVAGFGAASRIEHLTLVVFFALSAVIGPFMGQNLGAQQYQRMAEAMRLTAVFCIALGLTLALLLVMVAGSVMSLFSEEQAVLRVGILYLWIIPVSSGAYGIVMAVNAAFNGIGRPLPGVAVSVTRMMVLYLPLAYIGAGLAGVPGLFVGASIANLLTGVMAYAWFNRVISRYAVS